MPDSFPVGFGRYQLVDRLAVGGMAELYKATMAGAHDFHKRVVIKKILPHLAADAQFVAMFIDEAKITAQLQHPKIVQVFELGVLGNELFIAMELVEGPDLLGVLRHYASHRTRLPEEIAVHIAHELLDALDYAHHACDDKGRPLGIIHRDISPGNVLLSRRGNVKLTDFGIARAAANREHTQSGTLKGKYGYMSPEQVINADVDRRSDVFAVGVVLAEMLMGRRLFVAPSDLDVLLMVRDARLDRLDKHGVHLPADLRALLDRALRRDPAKRFQEAREFREALGDYLFAARRRVHASDVAVVVETVLARDRDPDQAIKSPPELSDALRALEFDELSTISGPDTRRRKLEAHEQAKIGRARFRRMTTSSGPGATTSGVPEPVEPSTDSTQPYRGGASTAATPDAEDGLELREEIEVGGALEPEPTQPDAEPAELAEAQPAPATETGDFLRLSPIKLIYRLVRGGATGLLEVELGSIRKQAYFVGGTPQFVGSNVASERFGQFLVQRGKLSDGELSMALSVLPHFGGKLADTLVGLGLMDPLGALKALRQQVEYKVVEVCTWEKGTYVWEPERLSPMPYEQLNLDGYKILGAGASALDAEFVQGWAAWQADRTPIRIEPASSLDRFMLGTRAHYVYHLLDGQRRLGELDTAFRGKDNWVDVLRIVYLLVQTEHVAMRTHEDASAVVGAEIDRELT